MKFVTVFIISASLLLSVEVFAQATMSPTGSAVPLAAKRPAIRNTYPGGQDEDDLQVQTQMITPTAILDRRTLNAKVIKNAKSESADQGDTDGESDGARGRTGDE